MITLLKIELKKILPNKTFWVLIGLYILLTGFILFSIQGIVNSFASNVSDDEFPDMLSFSLYRFPVVWHNLTYVVGFLKIFLAVVIIVLVTNEYSFKTIRLNISSGLSRTDFVLGKVLLTAFLSLLAVLLVFISGLILGMLNTAVITFDGIFDKFSFLLAYFLEIFTYLSFAMLIGFLLKRSGLSIGLLLLYGYIVEPIAVFYLPDHLERIMPLESVSRLIGLPKTSIMKLIDKIDFINYVRWEDAVISSGYALLFLFLVFLIAKKRDF
ncbi:MAG: ABC transporter permease [Bacteroidales bacterium]|nr:ABC transporter permease [Bacteroidales bacterium]MCF8345122.1 ABC transporter permease [Bacteroidales bacterium]MCF8352139.1 ABC transporter permease [Bacteroidales bacterium]MCF8375764.1 ABC transporter permease [Bacteroidales bacterium]MCF8400364.1 ABC transporter permease [Bacteroidales bacterium]